MDIQKQILLAMKSKVEADAKPAAEKTKRVRKTPKSSVSSVSETEEAQEEKGE